MASVKIIRWIETEALHAGVVHAAGEGVEAAVQESVSWIKNDVLSEQKYVGTAHFPDVKESTKKIKRKKGANKVLIDTGNYKDSWIGSSKGLEGRIQSGSDGYFANIHKKWRIDELWREEHSGEALEIIEKSIKKVL